MREPHYGRYLRIHCHTCQKITLHRHDRVTGAWDCIQCEQKANR